MLRAAGLCSEKCNLLIFIRKCVKDRKRGEQVTREHDVEVGYWWSPSPQRQIAREKVIFITHHKKQLATCFQETGRMYGLSSRLRKSIYDRSPKSTQHIGCPQEEYYRHRRYIAPLPPPPSPPQPPSHPFQAKG